MARVDEVLGKENGVTATSVTEAAASKLCTLAMGEYLYQEAGPRDHVYKVEKGVVAVFERRIGRPVNVIGLANQGDYFGLGCLEHHRDNARAVVESVISYMPRTEFDRLVDRDPTLKRKQDEAVKRDFEYGKTLASDRGRSATIECVAAFLVAVSRQNTDEGRDPSIVFDSGQCVLVTSLLLDMESSILEQALARLKRMGVIEPYPNGALHLRDIAALDRIANGNLGVSAQDATERSPTCRNQQDALSTALAAGWSDEIRETVWLIAVIGSLSAAAVGLAVAAAFASQYMGS
jgi:CRP/FNR family transcriptional regulator, anaerobic regulatory protein